MVSGDTMLEEYRSANPTQIIYIATVVVHLYFTHSSSCCCEVASTMWSMLNPMNVDCGQRVAQVWRDEGRFDWLRESTGIFPTNVTSPDGIMLTSSRLEHALSSNASPHLSALH
jgi:hypothetical protein